MKQKGKEIKAKEKMIKELTKQNMMLRKSGKSTSRTIDEDIAKVANLHKQIEKSQDREMKKPQEQVQELELQLNTQRASQLAAVTHEKIADKERQEAVKKIRSLNKILKEKENTIAELEYAVEEATEETKKRQQKEQAVVSESSSLTIEQLKTKLAKATTMVETMRESYVKRVQEIKERDRKLAVSWKMSEVGRRIAEADTISFKENRKQVCRNMSRLVLNHLGDKEHMKQEDTCTYWINEEELPKDGRCGWLALNHVIYDLSFFDEKIDYIVPGIQHYDLQFKVEDQLRIRYLLLFHFNMNQEIFEAMEKRLAGGMGLQKGIKGSMSGLTKLTKLDPNEEMKFAGLMKKTKQMKKGEQRLEEKHWLDSSWLPVICHMFRRPVIVLCSNKHAVDQRYTLREWVHPCMMGSKKPTQEELIEAASTIGITTFPIILIHDGVNHFDRFKFMHSKDAEHQQIFPKQLKDKAVVLIRDYKGAFAKFWKLK
jgi:myosin heavy subunit